MARHSMHVTMGVLFGGRGPWELEVNAGDVVVYQRSREIARGPVVLAAWRAVGTGTMGLAMRLPTKKWVTAYGLAVPDGVESERSRSDFTISAAALTSLLVELGLPRSSNATPAVGDAYRTVPLTTTPPSRTIRLDGGYHRGIVLLLGCVVGATALERATTWLLPLGIGSVVPWVVMAPALIFALKLTWRGSPVTLVITENGMELGACRASWNDVRYRVGWSQSSSRAGTFRYTTLEIQIGSQKIRVTGMIAPDGAMGPRMPVGRVVGAGDFPGLQQALVDRATKRTE